MRFWMVPVLHIGLLVFLYNLTNYNIIPVDALHDNPALFIPVICHPVAMDCFW